MFPPLQFYTFKCVDTSVAELDLGWFDDSPPVFRFGFRPSRIGLVELPRSISKAGKRKTAFRSSRPYSQDSSKIKPTGRVRATLPNALARRVLPEQSPAHGDCRECSGSEKGRVCAQDF